MNDERWKEDLFRAVRRAGRLWLFLDYDGTLAEFAPNPDYVEPDPVVIALLAKLAEHPRIRLAVVSGRRLSHIETLLPIEGAILAGTYGVEMRGSDGKRKQRVSGETMRAVLDKIKARWKDMLREVEGFHLEDKGFAIALHGRHADNSDDEVNQIIYRARNAAEGELKSDDFQILGGYKFLEVAPRTADKGKAINYLLEQYPWENAIPAYIGDDDKDEQAFEAVNAHDGFAILVAAEPRASAAAYRLASPKDVHHWLKELLLVLQQ